MSADAFRTHVLAVLTPHPTNVTAGPYGELVLHRKVQRHSVDGPIEGLGVALDFDRLQRSSPPERGWSFGVGTPSSAKDSTSTPYLWQYSAYSHDLYRLPLPRPLRTILRQRRINRPRPTKTVPKRSPCWQVFINLA